MSLEQESKPTGNEQLNAIPDHEIEALAEKLNRELGANAEKTTNNPQNTERLASKVEQLAVSGKEMGRSEIADRKQHPVLINKQLKEMAYSRAMTRVRKHLSIPSRTLSRVVHSKALEKPSEVIGNTIARPSGVLGGAFVAAIGSSILLWLTKHFGYSYNYLAVIMLFVVGLILGISVEAIWKILKKR